MSKTLGQNIHVALTFESVAGTVIAPNSGDYLPFGTIDIKNNIEREDTEANVGRFMTVQDKLIVDYAHEITITMPVDINHAVKTLVAFLGSVNSTNDTPESGVTTHVPEIVDAGTVKTLTVSTIIGAKQYAYPLGAVTSWKVSGSANKKPELTVVIQTKKRQTTTGLSASYGSLKYYKVTSPAFYMPLLYSNIGTANALKVREYSVELTREVEMMRYAGADTHEGVMMGAMTTKVNIVKDYDEETFRSGDSAYLDDNAFANVTRAFRMKLIETSYTFGASTNPSLTIDIPANKVTDHSPNGELKKITGETLDLEPIDNGSNDQVVANAVNDTASY